MIHLIKSIHLIKFASILLLTSSLSACIISINDGNDEGGWHKRQEQNARYINRLELGSSLASIEAELGDPDFIDSFNRNGEVYYVIYYRTHRGDSDGKTTRDETTPLVFINKQLAGWGKLAVEKATR